MGIVTTTRDLRSAIALTQQVNRAGFVQINTQFLTALSPTAGEGDFATAASVGDSRSTGVTATFAAHGAMPLPVIVSTPALKATLVGAKPKAEVAITVDPDADGNPHTLRVNAGCGEQRIPISRGGDRLTVDVHTDRPHYQTHTASVQVGELAAMLAAVETAIFHSEPRPELGGVLFEHPMTENGRLTLVASSLHRMHIVRSRNPVTVGVIQADADAKPEQLRRILPGGDIRTIKAACKRSDGSGNVDLELIETDAKQWARFRFPNGDSVLVRLLKRTYPQYTRLIPEWTDSGDAFHFHVDTAQMTDRLKAMLQSAPKGSKYEPLVYLDCDANWMRATTQPSDKVFASGPLPRKSGSNPGFEVRFSVKELHAAFAAIDWPQARVQIKDNRAVCRIDVHGPPDTVPEYTALIMPTPPKPEPKTEPTSA